MIGFELDLETSIGGRSFRFRWAGGPRVALAGQNGAGKTTLVKAVLGLVPGTRGRLVVAGAVLLDSVRGIDVAVEQRGLGWVPQHEALFPHLTVRHQVAFAAALAGEHGGARSRRVEGLLHALDLLALADRRPRALSGGERQRAALARALAGRARALVLDEPFSALDAEARARAVAVVDTELRERDAPLLVVTHDREDAQALQAEIVVIEDGRVVSV